MVRRKHRYFLVEILLEDALGGFNGTLPSSVAEGTIVSLVRDSVNANFGETGSAEVGGDLTVKYLSPVTRLVILRVSRAAFRTVWTALTFCRQLKGMECCFRVLHCGGTIRKTQQEAVRYHRRILLGASPPSSAAAAVAETLSLERPLHP